MTASYHFLSSTWDSTLNYATTYLNTMKHLRSSLASKANSAVGIATRLWAARLGAQIPVETRDIFSSPRPLDRPEN